MAELIRASGETTNITPRSGKAFELEELQALVHGYIEAIRLPGGRWMFVNEDGKRDNLPFNELATYRAHNVIGSDDYIVGDAIVMNYEEAGEEK